MKALYSWIDCNCRATFGHRWPSADEALKDQGFVAGCKQIAAHLNVSWDETLVAIRATLN